MTLEERLNVMGIESNTNGDVSEYLAEGQIPKTDNLLVLLVQGLQSNDAKMLNVNRRFFKYSNQFILYEVFIFNCYFCSTYLACSTA